MITTALQFIATPFWSQTTVEFLLLGLATGSLYAMFALSIVLMYRASGVLNFATGALGAYQGHQGRSPPSQGRSPPSQGHSPP